MDEQTTIDGDVRSIFTDAVEALREQVNTLWMADYGPGIEFGVSSDIKIDRHKDTVTLTMKIGPNTDDGIPYPQGHSFVKHDDGRAIYTHAYGVQYNLLSYFKDAEAFRHKVRHEVGKVAEQYISAIWRP